MKNPSASNHGIEALKERVCAQEGGGGIKEVEVNFSMRLFCLGKKITQMRKIAYFTSCSFLFDPPVALF